MIPKQILARPYLKFAVFILLILTPLAVIILIFTPLASKKTESIIFNQYSLPKNFTREDVLRVISNMRNDPEFQYYFLQLKENDVESAILEVLILLENTKTQHKLLVEIELFKEEVKSLALLFYNLELEESFYSNPEQFDHINKIMWKFLYEDFKLNILGICYKASFDQEFSFKWDQITRLSAQKLHETLLRINQD
ncbi:MAG: hypothetical protein H6755_06290 [Candidatus Omnitrophica bacterium]|nr:hypothetical protein [Candidatus Omnitrophota bacterium]